MGLLANTIVMLMCVVVVIHKGYDGDVKLERRPFCHIAVELIDQNDFRILQFFRSLAHSRDEKRIFAHTGLKDISSPRTLQR